MTEPLIWTAEGNLPIKDLRHDVSWQVSPDQVIFTESYFLGEKLVKQSSHVKILTGVSMSGEASI